MSSSTSILEKIELAVKLHQKQQFKQAETIYREILAEDENQTDALRLLGVILNQEGNFQEAVNLIEKAISLKPNDILAYFNLGNVYKAQGKFNKAIKAFEKIIELKPNYNTAYHNLGLIYQDLEKLDKAINYYKKSIEINPQAYDSYNNLGMLYKEEDNLEKAMECYEKAIEIKPDVAEIYNNLGNVYQDKEEWDKALFYYEKAITINPCYPEAHNNTGVVYQEKEEWDKAIPFYKKAMEFRPSYGEAYNNIAVAYNKKKDYENAIAYCKKSLELNPNSHEAYNNMAISYQDQGLWEKAIALYQKVLTIKPDYIEARNNLGLLLLLLGKLQEGWKESEGRFDGKTYKKAKPKTPMWDGSDLNGKSLIIWNEQGLGDAIQFVRYGKMAKEKGGKITIKVHPFLVSLFQECLEDKFTIIAQNEGDIYSYDEQISIMSLPYVLGTTLETIPGNTPYIFPPQNLRKHCILTPSNNLKVGIVWASHIKNKGMYAKKTCSAQLFMELLSIPNVHFYSLQVGVDAQQINPYLTNERVDDFSDKLKDFVDTATVVSQLDLVISIDTAVAHLAGAMNKPTWLLLPYVADWRWLLDRDDSPWYPSMKIFRQPSLKDWESVFADIKLQLQEVVNNSSFVNEKKLISQDNLDNSLRDNTNSKLSIFEDKNKQNLDIILSNNTDSQLSISEENIIQKSDVETNSNLEINSLNSNQEKSQKTESESKLYLGFDAHQAGKINRARKYYLEALELNPNEAEAWRLLGVIANNCQNYDKAIERLNTAMKLNPNNFMVYNNLAGVYKDIKQWQEAINYYNKALEINPNQGDSYNGLGNVYKEIENFDKALEAYSNAIKIEPQKSIYHCNLGLFLLLQGKIKEGFKKYEYRFDSKPSKLFKPKTPMWKGNLEELEGKSIIIWNEQGLGDSLQFIRYVSFLKQFAAKVVLNLETSLIPLYEECLLEEYEIVEESVEVIYEYDFHVSMMSLPHLFQTTLKTIPSIIPYILPPNKIPLSHLLADKDVKKVFPHPYRIGIVWASKIGNPSLYVQKTCPIESFIDNLLEIDNIALYSLQVGEDAEQIKPYLEHKNIYDCTSLINNFKDTATLIYQLDLVITVDTAVAHLAGAMGKPTWVILSYIPDWRWMLNRQDSPWYSTMRLFRQKSRDDWQSVFVDIKRQLKEVLKGSSPIFYIPQPQEKFNFSLKKNLDINAPSEYIISSNKSVNIYQSSSQELEIPSAKKTIVIDTKINKLLQQAVSYQQKGNIQEAKELYLDC